MKKIMLKKYYLAPITYNSREYFLSELETKSLRTLSKEIGLSVNTLQKIKNEEPVAYESIGKLIDWVDIQKGRTPLSKLLKEAETNK